MTDSPSEPVYTLHRVSIFVAGGLYADLTVWASNEEEAASLACAAAHALLDESRKRRNVTTRYANEVPGGRADDPVS